MIGTGKGRLILYYPNHGFVIGEPKMYADNEINYIEIAGYGKDFRDRIFFSDLFRIYGGTKKGKVLFNEKIHSIPRNWISYNSSSSVHNIVANMSGNNNA